MTPTSQLPAGQAGHPGRSLAAVDSSPPSCGSRYLRTSSWHGRMKRWARGAGKGRLPPEPCRPAMPAPACRRGVLRRRRLVRVNIPHAALARGFRFKEDILCEETYRRPYLGCQKTLPPKENNGVTYVAWLT